MSITSDRVVAVLDASAEVLDQLVGRVNERHVGGIPLAARQAVAHEIAHLWVHLRAGQLRADTLPATGDVVELDGDPDVLSLWLHAGRTAARIADSAMRFGGADGYLATHPASALRRDALAVRAALGRPDAAPAAIGRSALPAIGRNRDVRDLVVARLGGAWSDAHDVAAMQSGALHDLPTHRVIAEAGWLGAFLPHAGLNPDLTPDAAFGIAEALTVEGVPIYGLNTSAMAAAVVRDSGTPLLHRTVLPRLLDGTALCAIGYTEPGAGSDLAAIATQARRVDGGWELSGVKRHCTLADVASYAMVLARTSGTGGHRGMTLFLLPLDAAGLAVEMLPTHGGESTTQLTIDAVRVEDSHVLGEVDRGWSAVMAALRYERNASAWCDGVRLVEAAVEARRSAASGHRDAWDVAIGNAYADLVVGRSLVDVLLTDGDQLGAMASVAVKLFTTEATRWAADAMVRVLEPEHAGAVAAQRIEQTWRRAISLTIAGGANEVLCDVISRRGLGLASADRNG